MQIADRIAQFRFLSDRAGCRAGLMPFYPFRVGYIGWQGHGNLGDDLMYRAARRLFAPGILTPYGTDREERRLARIHLSGNRYFTSVILGGGTLINQQYAPLIRSALDQDIPVFSLGTGVGSSGFDEPPVADLSEWPTLLRRFQAVGVRGPRSGAALQRLGVEHVRVIGDLAMSLALRVAIQPSATPRIAINIAAPTSAADSNALNACLEDVRRAVQDLLSQGWELVPVAMAQKDVGALREFLTSLGHAPTRISQPVSAAGFFTLVGPCTFMIAVRLHAAALATCAGVPPLLLGYREKCLDFMQSMLLDELHVDATGPMPEGIQAKIFSLADSAQSKRNAILQRAQMWRQVQAEYVHAVRHCAQL